MSASSMNIISWHLDIEIKNNNIVASMQLTSSDLIIGQAFHNVDYKYFLPSNNFFFRVSLVSGILIEHYGGN